MVRGGAERQELCLCCWTFLPVWMTRRYEWVNTERKVQVLEWTCVLFIADEPKEIKYYLTH